MNFAKLKSHLKQEDGGNLELFKQKGVQVATVEVQTYLSQNISVDGKVKSKHSCGRNIWKQKIGEFRI